MRSRHPLRLGLALGIAAWAARCADKPVLTRPFANLQQIRSPASPESGQPALAVTEDGRVLLSWLELAITGDYRLRFAERAGDGWTDARTIIEGQTLFVNWADVPSIAALSGDRLAAQWLESNGDQESAYSVRVVWSADRGRTWSAPITPHDDESPTQHGFVSLYDLPGGEVGAVWLDGREFVGKGENDLTAEMALRAAAIDPKGGVGRRAIVDPRVCDCCSTAAVSTAGSVLVAYRDRSAGEVRDISVVRYERGAWGQPMRVHADDWQIPGCPVNGPALAAKGRAVAIAWFTAARNTARVLVAFSDAGGTSFGQPVAADDGVPLGRVDVALAPDGSALVSWIEHNGGNPEFRVRRVWPDGRRTPSLAVASIGGEPVSGRPRMVLAGRTWVFAWNAIGRGGGVRTAIADLE